MFTLSSKMMIRNFSLLLLLLFCYSNIQAATVIWNGGSGNWHVGGNWSGGSVPSPNDDVTIGSGSVLILTNISAFGKSLKIGSTASVTIQSSSSLTISGATIRPGIVNYGTINSLGDIIVTNIAGTNNHGIDNSGSIVSTGRMSISNIRSANGIRCNIGSVFQNDGSINIFQISSHCLYNEGDFTNNRDIIIGNTNGDGLFNLSTGHFINLGSIEVSPEFNCLQNSGRFDNEVGGRITLNGNNTNPTFAGLLNYSGTQLFTNRGIIEINNCQNNIYISSGELLNLAKIYSNDAHLTGVRLSIGGTLRNKAELWVRDGLVEGVKVQGFFLNTRYANLFVLDNVGDGVLVENNAELRNFGNINILDSGQKSVLNNGTISNRPRGRLTVSDQVLSENGSTIVNRGHLFNTFTGAHINNGGTITNLGIIGDPARSFDGMFTNQKVRVVPIQGPVNVGQTVSNVLNKVSLSGISVGAWRDLITGDIVGSYNAANNTFTPNNNAIGLTEIIVALRINGAGSWFYYRVPIIGGVQPLVAHSSAPQLGIDDDSYSGKAPFVNTPTDNDNYKVYPNPVQQNIFIEVGWPLNGNMRVSLTNLLGQEVFIKKFETMKNKTEILIPKGLVNGNYLLTIWKKDQVVHSQQLILVQNN